MPVPVVNAHGDVRLFRGCHGTLQATRALPNAVRRLSILAALAKTGQAVLPRTLRWPDVL